jgi:VWFA-related protein
MFDTANNIQRQTAWKVVIGLAALAWPLGARSGAVEPRTESRSLYLNVEKGSGLISGLTQENFRLYVDGKPQPFRLEKPEEPASVALLVEHSGSSGYFADDLNAALQGFLKHAPEGHWYALATFSHELEIQTDFTKQIGEITGTYSQLGLPTWSEIDTYDAVYEMLDKMGRLPGRRILIVVGSGLDTFSEHGLRQVQKKAEGENVTIFVAGLGSLFRGVYDSYLDSSARMSLVQAQAFLQMLATKTGGFAWFPNQFNAFSDVIQGIMQSIATQYRLVFEAPLNGSGKFHKVKVEAFRVVNDKREDFKVLVREGWR